MKLPRILIENSPIREYPAGATIFHAGDAAEEMFVVIEGEVSIHLGDKVVETLGPDQFFGELALIDKGPRSGTAVARTDCKLASVNQQRFTFVVDEVPFFALRVMKVMADRLRRKDVPAPPTREPVSADLNQ